jgi:hypothetical protein
MQYDGATLRDVECLVRTPQWPSQHFCLLVLTDYYNSDQINLSPWRIVLRNYRCCDERITGSRISLQLTHNATIPPERSCFQSTS